MWKGAISFGLVSIPVSLGVAVRHKEVGFHQVHDSDGGRIRQKRVCELDGKEVPYPHVAKGYEVAKGRVVVLSREELKALDPAADKTIAIEAFVDPSEVDPLYLESSYYVVPDARAGAGKKAYALFAAVLEKQGRAAIARIVISTKQHMCMLRAQDGRLVLTTMVWGDEVEVAPPVPGVEPTAKELELARALVHSMDGRFTPDQYEDEHRKRVEKLLAQKAAGQAIELPEAAPVAAPVADLVEALQQSLAGARREGAPAKTHRARRTARARRRRTA